MTTEKPRLLKIKARLKKRQPKFIRQDAHKRAMKEGWRSPKGLHSKIGDNRKGYRMPLRGGFQTPRAVRGMDKIGLYPTRVDTLSGLATLDPKVHSVIVSRTLGGRKKLIIIDAAKTKGFSFTNVKTNTVDTLKSRFAEKAKRREERTTKMTQKQKAVAEKGHKAAAKAAEKGAEKESAEKKETAAAAHNVPHEHMHTHQKGEKPKTE